MRPLHSNWAAQSASVSNSRERATWQNSTLIRGNVAQEIAALKEQPGKNINLSGSGTLVTWLLQQGLLDELHLLVFPVAVGRGKRLLDGVGEQMPLRLVATQAFGSGVVHLQYAAATR